MRRLLIADLHLGKADVFRRAGIGLPRGGTTHDLQRLTALIDATRAQQLWILGDVLHGPAPEAAWRGGWELWRRHHGGLHVSALSGNHDRALMKAGLEIELLGPNIDEAPFSLRHDPQPHERLHVICGHLHPVMSVPGIRRRWPAFWLQSGMTVLPAFSTFTGGYRPLSMPGNRVVACVEGDAVPFQWGRP